MATNLKFKRTSTTSLPTGLTFGEPAFVLGSAGTTTANQLYIGDNSGGRVWIGAKIENTVSNWTGTEANSLLATQQAIDARITSRISTSGGFTFAATSGTPQTLTPGDTITIAAGSGISTTAGATDTITVANTGVLSFNSLTGAVTGVGSFNGLTGSVTGVSSNIAGSGISVSGATGNVTITNTGVTGIQAGTGISVNANTGNVTVTNNGVLSFNGSTGAVTGVSSAVAGTGISVSGATGAVTFTNTGVQSISGTTNQITASGSTGAVTLSLPSAVTMPGSLTVTGNLTVNGTTTTVNSTTITVQDPIISIGGLTGGIAPAAGDTKDRGIVALYRNTSDTAGLTGFFGIDQSTGYFTFVPNATVTSEVVGGTAGTAVLNGVYSTNTSNLLLQGTHTSNAQVVITGAATDAASQVAIVAGSIVVGDATAANGTVKLYDTTGNFTGALKTTSLVADRTYTLPDHTGTVVVPTNLGTSGYILKANGTTTQPTWIDPTASGFTAYAATNATNVVTTEQSTGTYYLAFASGANATGTGLSVDATATTPLSYNVGTGTLTCVAVDALIDGGAY